MVPYADRCSMESRHLKIPIGIPIEEEGIVVNRLFESLSPIYRINLINDIQNTIFYKEGDYSIVI